MRDLAKPLALVATLVLTLSAQSDAVSARRVVSTLGVQVNIAAHCTVDAQMAARSPFARAAGTRADARGTATITTTCTCGSDPLVTLSAHHDGRGCAAVWNAEADSDAPECGSEVPQTFTVYGPERDRDRTPGCGDAVVANVTF